MRLGNFLTANESPDVERVWPSGAQSFPGLSVRGVNHRESAWMEEADLEVRLKG